MTAIIAYKNGGDIYMGADRCISHGDEVLISSYPKIYYNNGALIGMAGSSLQIASIEQDYDWPITEHDTENLHDILKGKVLPKLRDVAMQDVDEDERPNVDMLIAWGSDIIYIHNLRDVTLIEKAWSIGCFPGIHNFVQLGLGSPEQQIRQVLNAAHTSMPGAICPPFDVWIYGGEDE